WGRVRESRRKLLQPWSMRPLARVLALLVEQHEPLSVPLRPATKLLREDGAPGLDALVVQHFGRDHIERARFAAALSADYYPSHPGEPSCRNRQQLQHRLARQKLDGRRDASKVLAAALQAPLSSRRCSDPDVSGPVSEPRLRHQAGNVLGPLREQLEIQVRA